MFSKLVSPHQSKILIAVGIGICVTAYKINQKKYEISDIDLTEGIQHLKNIKIEKHSVIRKNVQPTEKQQKVSIAATINYLDDYESPKQHIIVKNEIKLQLKKVELKNINGLQLAIYKPYNWYMYTRENNIKYSVSAIQNILSELSDNIDMESSKMDILINNGEEVILFGLLISLLILVLSIIVVLDHETLETQTLFT